MRRIATLAIFLFFLVSCGVQNSVNNDVGVNGTAATAQSAANSPSFQAAHRVMLVSCIQCHTAWATANETYFRSNGGASGKGNLVIPGSPDQSKLYQALRGAGSGGSMPPMYQMSDAEVKMIHDWIAGMSP